ncbi:MAG: hypothetical protein ACTH9T_09725 [Mycetocola reblochoni]|uniref:hypothetical protein n=1 Tax=Mycetocola reblochoni TaxID=331618 RepID=UPI003F985B5B
MIGSSTSAIRDETWLASSATRVQRAQSTRWALKAVSSVPFSFPLAYLPTREIVQWQAESAGTSAMCAWIHACRSPSRAR